MLNKAGYNSFLDIFTVYLKTIYHVNLKYYFEGILQFLKSEFQMCRILEVLNFHTYDSVNSHTDIINFLHALVYHKLFMTVM